MALKKIIFIVFVVFLACNIHGQSIQRYVIGSGSSSNTGKLQSNIGELIVATYANSVNIISQGFVQNEQLSITTHVDALNKNSANVYPNPFTNLINIEFSEQLSDLTIDVVDLLGKSHPINFDICNSTNSFIYKLSFEESPVGIYFVRVYSSKNNFNQVFKVLKI